VTGSPDAVRAADVDGGDSTDDLDDLDDLADTDDTDETVPLRRAARCYCAA
jgi:hypothetical protein